MSIFKRWTVEGTLSRVRLVLFWGRNQQRKTQVPTTRTDVLEFMRSYSLAVQASVSPSNSPQAAVVGFIVTEDFEIFFDTLATARKIPNLRRNPRLAIVIGGLTRGEERTVQYEGMADEPSGPDLDRLKERYFIRFPDGRDRQSWAGLTYVRVRPHWIRFSNFSQTPPEIVEFRFGSPPALA